MNILEKLKIDNCTGCHSCYSCCPVYVIKMKRDSEGFLKPSIDYDKCINCGKCVISCPIINPPVVNTSPNYVFAAYCKDRIQHKQSASGGVFAIAAKYILEQNGYVVGAAFDSELYLKHIIIHDKSELTKLVGTKYVQSEIGNVYKEVKNLLENDKMVLFSGTSCQIAGLKTFLKKDYKKLFCIDLICHGVPSPAIWSRYLYELSPDDTIINMTFRDKTKDNKKWPLVFKCKSGKEIIENYQDNKFIIGFINNYYLRLSCYKCRFKGLKRSSDITIGDFWGLERYDISIKSPDGTSVVIIHSEKGRNLFNYISNGFHYKQMPEDIIYKDNSCLIESVPLSKKRNLLFKYYKKNGLLVTIDKLSKPTVRQEFSQIMWKIRTHIGKMLKHRR